MNADGKKTVVTELRLTGTDGCHKEKMCCGSLKSVMDAPAGDDKSADTVQI